jgi:RNA polymerase sigma-70 factor (ECF subfamily)
MTDAIADDEELGRRAAAGDASAIDILLQRHLAGLRAFVRLRASADLRAKESSIDVVQSVCREVLEQKDRFQHGGSEGFRHWLFRTAQRKIADRRAHWQSAKRDVRREVAGDPDVEVLSCYASFCTPSRDASAREQLRRVESAFDSLPAAARDLILEARVLGVPRAEIAARTGVWEGAVRWGLMRAMAALGVLLVAGVDCGGPKGVGAHN